jgi:hypothetical protein
MEQYCYTIKKKKMYYKIIKGIAKTAQIDINGFDGDWAEAEDGFGVGDLWNEEDGWSHPVKTTEELESEARDWRDKELTATDFIVSTTDYPNHSNLLAYRQELRDWPSTSNFPVTKPTKP